MCWRWLQYNLLNDGPTHAINPPVSMNLLIFSFFSTHASETRSEARFRGMLRSTLRDTLRGTIPWHPQRSNWRSEKRDWRLKQRVFPWEVSFRGPRWYILHLGVKNYPIPQIRPQRKIPAKSTKVKDFRMAKFRQVTQKMSGSLNWMVMSVLGWRAARRLKSTVRLYRPSEKCNNS
jgi:hypothetical protein